MSKRQTAQEIQSPLEAIQTLGQELRSSSSKVSVLTYKPHAKQRRFHGSSKKVRLYIGGNRSGKTVGGVIEGIYFLRRNHPFQKLPIAPGESCRARAIGVDFDNGIDKILLPQYAQSIPKSLLINGSWEDSYNGSKRVLTLRDGGFVEFMSYDQDLDKFAGTSRHYIHMDEEPPKNVYTENYARTVDVMGKIWITMTPVEGMTWVFDTLYEPGIMGTKKNVEVIVVDLTENPYLSDEAKQDFIESLDEEDLAARIHGRFIQMGGLIYKVFDPNKNGRHVIDRTLKPPRTWEVIMGLDHGFNNPTAVGWHMVSPEGDIITYAEHYKSGFTIAEHAEVIKAEMLRQGRIPDQMIADPSIKSKDPITGTSIQQEYARHGIHLSLGNNDVKAGIIRVNGYLKPRKQANGKVRALWHITVDCPMHIKEMSRYRWKTYVNKKDQDDKNPYEEPHKKDDHAMDELRYVMMSRPDIISDIPQEAQEVANRLGMPMPGVIGHNANAGDFHSMSGYQDPADYSPYENTGKMEIEYDEHMGGVV